MKAITINNISKRYRLGGAQQRSDTLRDALVGLLRNPFAATPASQEFWALRDVSFDVQPGEAIALVGRNGAGKSTLLKVLSRITEPTSGTADLQGRVGSLLEVGTGFHPELTGRENIYLNGAILGMQRVEIARKFDEIVAFAEIEKFLDTPVKRYSSGMYVRLAFAVAAHLEPEILLVDEVLAVGDASFQKKCLGKMSDVAHSGGRTVVFVSHNMTAVQALCDRAVWLDQGKVREIGSAAHVVQNYLQTAANATAQQTWPDLHSAPGNDKARLRSVSVRPTSGVRLDQVTVETDLDLTFAFWNYQPNAELNFSIFLHNLEDICIFNVVSEPRHYPVGLVTGTCHIPGGVLNDATYRVRLLVVQDTSVALVDAPDVLVFEVQDVERTGNWYGKWPGAVRPNLQWRLEFTP
jgi:lipopolysaccharide transport system ATP-binding protein